MTITTLEQAIDILARAVTPDGQPAFPSCRRPCPCADEIVQRRADGINHWYDMDGCRTCWIEGRGRHVADCSTCHGHGWMAHWPGIGPTMRDIRALGWGWTLCETSLVVLYNASTDEDACDVYDVRSGEYEQTWAIALASAAIAAGLAQEVKHD